MKILLIEDNTALRRTMSFFLQGQGHTVTSHTNGRTAFEEVKNNCPDLIITDIIMPIMDGYEFLMKLRQTVCASRTPVVVISALTSIYQEHTAAKFGANSYLRKPFTKLDLELVVDKYAA